MDIQLYEGLKFHVKNLKTPKNIPEEIRQKILRTAHNFTRKGETLYWIKNDEERIVIKESQLENILHNGHSSLQAGHFDAQTTYHRLYEHYYWPKMLTSIQTYVQTCNICQRRGKAKRTEPLNPIPVGEIFDRWGMDIVGPLSETEQGNKYIIVATEYLTKWPEAQAIPDTKAKTVAKFFYEQIICRYGAPKVILTDQGSSFENELINSLCEVMGSKHKLATAYHPQTNGLTERFNKTLCETIAKFILHYNREWDHFVHSALFAYRTRKQSTTRFEPFFLLYGRKAQTPLTRTAQEHRTEEEELEWEINEQVEKITSKLDHVRKVAKENITRSQAKQKERFDRKIKIESYNIGDEVLLERTDTKMVHGDKFRELFTGPFRIHQVIGNGSYKLYNQQQGRIMTKAVNNTRLIKFYRRPDWEGKIYINNTR